jgi:orotidine-5'-phosphate decarboxylase
MQQIQDRLVFALDVKNAREEADGFLELFTEAEQKPGWIKVNSAFTGLGPAIIKKIAKSGFKPWLDMKFFDIPDTVGRHVQEAARIGAKMLTIHALGTKKMIKETLEKAVEAAEELGEERPLILAVTILTSMDKDDMNEIGIPGEIEDEVKRLAQVAIEAGADGTVSSPKEAPLIRPLPGGRGILIVTPGIRFRGGDVRDHNVKRVTTPKEAIELGADMVVMGSDLKKGIPEENVKRALAEIEEGLKSLAA